MSLTKKQMVDAKRALELLKEGGWLGFVLPKNLLRVDSFKGIRKHILDNCVIHQVFDIGHYFKDVRCDQIILILQKIKLSDEDARKHILSGKAYENLKRLQNV